MVNNPRALTALELFSGQGTISAELSARGWKTITIDQNPRFAADLTMDIMHLQPGTFRKLALHPALIWASVPCQKFSVLQIRNNWKNGKPANAETRAAIALLNHTVRLIKALKPIYYFIENPRGMMRKMAALNGRMRHKITYCQYGFNYQKPTDIWTNCKTWRPRQACASGDPCHEAAPRGLKGGLQSTKKGPGRSSIPQALAVEIAEAVTPQIKPIARPQVEFWNDHKLGK